MSTMEFKTVLRAKLPHITSTREHLKFLKAKLGEPTFIEDDSETGDEEDEGYLWFKFDPRKSYRDPVHEPFYEAVSDGKTYGVELVLRASADYPNDVAFTVASLKDMIESAALVWGIHADLWVLHTYGWYNGGDEPIKWEP
jgi:hypothetical protein